eukprot:1382984-Pleurochrysis_carterae.AAC.1
MTEEAVEASDAFYFIRNLAHVLSASAPLFTRETAVPMRSLFSPAGRECVHMRAHNVRPTLRTTNVVTFVCFICARPLLAP